MDTNNLRDFQSQPQRRAILDERARALATLSVAGTSVDGELTIRFRLGDGRYALSARHAREIQPLRAFSPLFGAPSFISGLVNVHGRLLALIDIRPLLNLPTNPPLPGSFLIVLEGEGNEIALLTDSILGMTTDPLSLSPAPDGATHATVPWVRGVDRDLSLVIDPIGLLADPRLIVEYHAGA